MTNEEYWADKHDRGPKTTGVGQADPKLIALMDDAILAEWKATIDDAVATYHGDECKTDGTNRHYTIVAQMAEYYTVHQCDFTGTESAEGIEDQVSEMDIADLYHFLRWQSMKYDIWIK